MNILKPRVRGSFSDRNGIEVINCDMQIETFDERTRNNIINFLDSIISYIIGKGRGHAFYEYVYLHIFQVTGDEMPSMQRGNYNYVRAPIYVGIKSAWEYNNILDFIESTLIWINKNISVEDAISIEEDLNKLFKKECVGYRFIKFIATGITNQQEIETIKKALNTKYDACNKSIEKAIKYLYDKEQPDYENSVKESISAIEGMCNIINGTKNKSLGDALKELEKNGVIIHKSMKEAFNKLYGYTSDKSGIRHNAGIDEKTTFEEAQYMLVSCSAFLNYLIRIYENN